MTQEKQEFEEWAKKYTLVGVDVESRELCLRVSKDAWQASRESLKQELLSKLDPLRDALLDMIWQFCSQNDKLAHSFMSAEEYAFDVLDLNNGMTYEEAEIASKAALQAVVGEL